MTTPHDRSLTEQRESIRKQLSVQRQQIARVLTPVVGASTLTHFPRSRIMRLLSHRPVLLLAKVAALMTAYRVVGSGPTAIIVTHLLRAGLAARTLKSRTEPKPH